MYQLDSPYFHKDVAVATLLTASATTGWLDWIHGELWLFPHGLLRIPLNFGATLLHGVGPTVNRDSRPQRSFDPATFQTLSSSPKNVWIPRETIQKAYLHRGYNTDRLRLILADQRCIKLLWLPLDEALEPLQATLAEWLGNELIID